MEQYALCFDDADGAFIVESNANSLLVSAELGYTGGCGNAKPPRGHCSVRLHGVPCVQGRGLRGHLAPSNRA